MSSRRQSNESSRRQSGESSRRESVESVHKNPSEIAHDEALRRYSYVTKLVHYTSKFATSDQDRRPTLKTPVRHPPPSRVDRRRSTLTVPDRTAEARKPPRLISLWPEWNETDVNAESWDVGSGKKKETGGGKARADAKSASSVGTHGFEDPEGKIELPPTLKVDQWKRPIDFLPADRTPVIVDSDHGMQSFDLVTTNEHLHYSETMRNIISQITALWDICRRDRKSSNATPDNISEPNSAVLSGRTWRPWEHIYALNKVSRQPFITPYNPAGKYAIRLFFLGTWRKIIIDDTIPFDSKNRCLLPQTALSYELWPMLLSKALLKIISLDFRSSGTFPEYNETTVIHALTGWLPEPIPLKYTHAKKVWEFLRHDRSNKLVSEADGGVNKLEQPTSPVPTFGPVPLFKWPDIKGDSPEESMLFNPNDPASHHDDSGTETMTKKSDEKSAKKGGAPGGLAVPKEGPAKSATGRETRGGGGNPGGGKDAKKAGGGRGAAVEDPSVLADDQTIPEAPKIIVFATIPHLQPSRISSYGETADRSEKLRRYNLNDIFSTSMQLTSIRDIPLEPPPPPEYIPPWKLVRPRKPKVLPHAEPVAVQEVKPDRWIEIASPYINYPSPSALHMNAETPTLTQPTRSRLSHSAAHSTIADVHDIIEVDEEGDIENIETKPDTDGELVSNAATPNLIKKEELLSPNKEINTAETPDPLDESTSAVGSKLKREKSADKNKSNRKLAGSKLDLAGTKPASDAVSVKSRGGESEQNATPLDVHATGTNNEQVEVQSKSNEAHPSPQIVQPVKKNYITPKIWMDFDDFCSCFTSVVVFHNPRGYQYIHKHTEVKFFTSQQPVIPALTKEKKKDSNPQATQQLPNLQDEKSPLYLFVDSTKDTADKTIELIVSLTSLSRWYDSGPGEGGPAGPTMATIAEKPGRGGGGSIDKTTSEVSPARGLGSRQRTSTIDLMPQTPAPNVTLNEGNTTDLSQKEMIPQPGSLIAEVYSWKSLSIGQPILRLHTTATKAALLTLPPGRHVLKFTVACPLASHLQIMSDTNDFTFGDEDQLLSKIVSVSEDAEFIARADELFLALDDAVQNFNNMEEQDRKLNEIFHLYCEYAPQSANLTVHACWRAFNEALYSTLRTTFQASGQPLTADMQFAWRCFTNDLTTPDIMGAYEAKRPSTSGGSRNSARAANAPGAGGTGAAATGAAAGGKKGAAGGKDKGADDKAAAKQQAQAPAATSMAELQEEPLSDWLTRELSANEMDAIINIQKSARGYLQRRILIARTPGSEKNLLAQRILQTAMATLKADPNKSASLLFRNLMVSKPQLIQCFEFRNDDWNMVTYRDYHGQYQEQPANTWFALFREIFYVVQEGLVSAKLLAHAQNSLLRVINNDTYEEMSLVFNRLAPAVFTKNKLGYTFFAEALSADQPLNSGRFRLRLLTSYTHLPEPRYDQITASFLTKEIKDYYVPNQQQVICRYRVIIGDDVTQTGRNFHLASIQFSASKSDVLMRLTILNNNDEVASVDGKGSVVLPAFLFMRDVTNAAQSTTTAQPSSRPTSKTAGGNKKEGGKTTGGNTHRGSVPDSTALGSGRSDKDKSGSGKRSRSSSRTGITTDEEQKLHKYVIQVTLLRKSWPLTPTQWQFVEQLKEQEKNELKIFNRQPSPTKVDGATGGGAGGTGAAAKKAGQTGTATTATAAKGKGAATGGAGAGKTGSTTSGRPGTGKGSSEKNIDTNKPHWFLRVVSDADRADEITIKKDNERNEELINMKKAWETFESGRAQKAMKSRQKFLESLQPKAEERPPSSAADGTFKRSESRVDGEGTAVAATPPTNEQQQQQPAPKQAPTAVSPKKSTSAAAKKAAAKDEAAKQAELAAAQELIPLPVADEPLLNQPPPSKPKVILPPIDTKPFIKQKMLLDEPVILDPLFEQEELRRRQASFLQYAKHNEEIRQTREEDHSNRYKEKIRQLEEYINLQARIDQSRRTINEPREAFRQCFLEIERKRLAELAAQEQELIAAAEKAKAAAAPTKGKGSAGKKGKK